MQVRFLEIYWESQKSLQAASQEAKEATKLHQQREQKQNAAKASILRLNFGSDYARVIVYINRFQCKIQRD